MNPEETLAVWRAEERKIHCQIDDRSTVGLHEDPGIGKVLGSFVRAPR